MRNAPARKSALAIALVASGLLACAGHSEGGPTILAGTDAGTREGRTAAADPRIRALDAERTVPLPFRGPSGGGVAYLLRLEADGERASRNSYDDDSQQLVRETYALEAEFRVLPTESTDSNDEMFLVGLDGLLYTQSQQNPKFEREIEIGDDRLRIKNNGETAIDNRGNRVVGALDPRLFVNRIFGVVKHDKSGNPTRLSARGAPAAREFMNSIPLLGAIAYTMIPLPEEPIRAGSRWSGVRIPPSRSGELGISLKIDYVLTGFDLLENVPCAMILLNAELDENAFTGLTGLQLDQVQAALSGTAWVELESSRVRRVVMNDQIRASWTAGPGDPKAATEHRIQQAGRYELSLRDAARKSKKWSDGTLRFDSR